MLNPAARNEFWTKLGACATVKFHRLGSAYYEDTWTFSDPGASVRLQAIPFALFQRTLNLVQ